MIAKTVRMQKVNAIGEPITLNAGVVGIEWSWQRLAKFIERSSIKGYTNMGIYRSGKLSQIVVAQLPVRDDNSIEMHIKD